MARPGPAVPLGAFDLLRPIARGGMAQVWLAKHRQHGIPVAVKVLTGHTALHPDFLRRFNAEVRAVAALDHPGVVMILDHGHVDARAVRYAGDLLTEGAPWLAMEYLSGGTLSQRRPMFPWRTVETLALALLEALSHAHARDVVHRDLKPANVLIARQGDLRPGIRITDFGIAWAGAADLEDERIVGTPSTMSPEQIRGQWRDFGPWTDLYAFGCLMWWLVSGAAPFAHRGGDVGRVLAAHLHEELPAFRPRIAVPEGFEAWLHRLLDKDWRARFAYAADVAASLKALGEAPWAPADPALQQDGPELSITSSLTGPFGEAWRLSIEDSNLHPAPVSLPPHRPWIAPIPDDWRRPVTRPTPIQLIGAGLSLYGLRPVPFAGRIDERDQLWRAFRKVADGGRARVVVVRGPAGTGKSRMVEWLGRRGHELGLLGWCRASFTRGGVTGEALRAMANRALRTDGLSRVDVRERVDTFLHHAGGDDPDGADVLTEVLQPTTEAERQQGLPGVQLPGARAQDLALVDLMRRRCLDRPQLLWLDDVQWGLDGIQLVLELMRAQEEAPFPCLAVLTVRDDALGEGSAAATALDQLHAVTSPLELTLGPLSPADHRELVRLLLGLDDDLARRVEERTQGNPQFAVQLVGAWVQDGTLEVGQGGFRLKAGVPASLPDDLHAVWAAQIEQVLAAHSPEARRCLEVAACLGEVDRDAWGVACDGDARSAERDEARDRLVERLLGLHLAEGVPAGWRFVHGMVRESLLRTAREEGRLPAHHRACARMLAMSAGDDPRMAERLGRHLLEAGDPGAALGPLLRGAEHLLVAVGPEPARRLHEVAQEAMAGLDPAATDPRWGHLWIVKAQVCTELKQLPEALVHARRARAHATHHGWASLLPVAMVTEARLLLRLGQLDEAAALFERLEVESRTRGDAGRRGVALLGLSELAKRRRDPAAAAALQDMAVGVLQAAQSTADAEERPALEAELARALLLQGRAAQQGGDLDAAAALYDRAHAHFEALGSALGTAEALDRRARILAAQGDPELAATLWTRALSRYEALGSERAFACRMRLVQAVLRHATADAWPIAARIQSLLARLGREARLGASLGLQLLRAAIEHDVRRYDADLDEVMAGVARLVRHGDSVGATVLAWLLQLAGESWLAHGDGARAQVALHHAARAWRSLGRREQLTQVEALISQG